jgi:hypothetical protein
MSIAFRLAQALQTWESVLAVLGITDKMQMMKPKETKITGLSIGGGNVKVWEEGK